MRTKIRLAKIDFVLLGIVMVFASIYALISIGNHLHFRTYGLDLGYFQHAVYSVAHLQKPMFTLDVHGIDYPFLAAHFSLITYLYAPFYYLFGEYTVLIIQIAAILLGSYGVFKYSRFLFGNKGYTYLLVVHFLSIWGIYSALSFDFHNNVIGAMLVPWLVYFVEKRKTLPAFIMLLLMLMTKEIMAFWAASILIALALKNRKSEKAGLLRLELPMILFSLLYGFVVIVYLMPSLQGTQDNIQLSRYSHLGNSWSDIVINVLRNPKLIYEGFFVNTTYAEVYDHIKTETYVMFLVAGGLLLLFRWEYIIMILPILALKMMSNNYGFWGINNQYSIELVPLISLTVVAFLQRIKKGRWVTLIILCLITMLATFGTFRQRKSKWHKPENVMFYHPVHYQHEINPDNFKKARHLIPDSASVSASTNLIPHVHQRQYIYHFPVVKDADYVLVSYTKHTWPLDVEGAVRDINHYLESGAYKEIYKDEELILLQKLK